MACNENKVGSPLFKCEINKCEKNKYYSPALFKMRNAISVRLAVFCHEYRLYIRKWGRFSFSIKIIY